MSDIIDKLHPLERKVLPHLKEGLTFSDLIELSKLKDVEVMRAIQWLSNKEVLKLSESKDEIIELDTNGIEYQKKGLPERRYFDALNENPDEFISDDALMKKASLSREEFGVSTGALKKQAAIITEKKDGKFMIKVMKPDMKLSMTALVEPFLIKSGFPISVSQLKPEHKFAVDALKKRRGIIKIETKKTITISLTKLGKELINESSKLKSDIEENLTPEMLKSGKWKGKKFRHFDIKINVPSITGGKRHFVRQSIDHIKRVWLDLGFKEMQGTMVQSSFWDLDCLFVPQDHPARAMQDTFYIKDPAKAKLPTKLKKKIKDVHETGADTGSKGWGNKWSEDEASQNMLRTHTTVLSAQTISKLKKEDLPAKFFSVNKVFRNEALTWKHLFEFHQVEGIVIDPNATLKHLKGYLKEFYTKLGFKKVRMRPAHFPYTEPSLEVDVFHPEKKEWIELGGAGIFRPEVVKPLLGIDVPVLAWGQGLERGIMQYYKFKDIRQLYNNNLKEIKEVKIWK